MAEPSLTQSTALAVRILLALVAAVAGYVALTQSLAEAIAKGDPARAYGLAIGNGRITGHFAEHLFQTNPQASADARSAQLARRAIRQDATAISAVTVLGAQAQLRGDIGNARHLFVYAQSLSRRDLQTQLWAIEEAIARNDIPAALGHYDIALRTSRTAPDILFPVLAQALSDAAIRTNLVPVLAKRPPWGQAFLSHAIGSEADSRDVSRLFMALRSAGAPVRAEASASLINRLLLYGHPDDAWLYYAGLRQGLDRRRSRDPLFGSNPASLSQLDWVAVEGSDAAVTLQRSESGGVVDFSVPSGLGGPLLQQVQMLPPGSYRLSGSSSGIDQPDAALPYWTLTCRDGRELGRVSVARSEAKRDFAGQFTVPAGCPVQLLALVARPADGVSGVSGQITRAELTPQR